MSDGRSTKHAEAARAALEARDPATARLEFERAAEEARAAGAAAQADYFEGEARLLEDDVKAAIEALRRACEAAAELGPLARAARFALGNALHRAGYGALAAEAYKEALAAPGEDPPESRVAFRLATVLARERAGEAVPFFERAYYAAGASAVVKRQSALALAELQHALGAPDRAIAWFDRIAADPTYEPDALFHYAHGNALLDAGHRARAADAYSAALARAGDDAVMRARALHNLGLCAAKAGDLAAALARFEEALAIPEFEPSRGAWRFMGQVAFDAGRPAAAGRLFRAALGELEGAREKGAKILKPGGGARERAEAAKLAARCDIELRDDSKLERERTIARHA